MRGKLHSGEYLMTNDILFQFFMSQQKEEVEKHKWIESEKAGRDLGEQAVIEWISKYAPHFRSEWEQKHGLFC